MKGKSTHRPGPVKVHRATQSPMDAQRWCMELDCGHDEWVILARKPQRKTMCCSTCFKQWQERA